jgi:ketosteroid isomerase-like protein
MVCRKSIAEAIMADLEFERFFTQRVAAAEAYVNGDPKPLEALVARQGEASFHSPRGDSVGGAEAVATRYRDDAGSFQPGGTSSFDILHKQVSEDLAFWTGWQVATVHLAGRAEPVSMKIRVTEVFRKIADGWKLVHRHADLGGGS